MHQRFITVFVIIFLLRQLPAGAQVLFSYGNKSVSKQEFLKAFNKNNTQEQGTREAMMDYLDLYTRYKLKVQAAKDLRLDTLSAQRTELTEFRNQLVESYMNNDVSIAMFIDEAIERSATEVHLAHIFIPAGRHLAPGKTQQAEKRINDAYLLLNKGEPFEKVAKIFSEDSSVTHNNGDIGFISVFTLPYDLEQLAYSTPEGKYSAPYRSSAGFHIFKNLGVRKSPGKVNIAQILLAFPPEATQQERDILKKRADSIRNLLVKGGEMAKLAATFSNDPFSFETGGELPAFGAGRYEPAFENAVFRLQEGQISEPVLTTYGYHIIKMIKRLPVETDKTNKLAREEFRQQVLNSDRMEAAKKVLLNAVMKTVKFKKHPVSQASFKKYTDSLLKGKMLVLPDLKPSTPLFSMEKKVITLKEWTTYLQTLPELEEQVREAAHIKLFNDYIETVVLEYYRNNLHTYNAEFAYQLNDFKDGNLLFEIMQRKVWNPAAADSAGLRRFYETNKSKYWWEQSADALIFTVANETAAEQLKQKLQKDPRAWRMYIDSSEGLIQGDSTRFELSQIPVVDRTNFQEKLITAPVKNENDNSLTFAYIIRMYRDRAQRSFEDARGFVINDYQNYLEEKWLETLKKKYPVKVNQAVLNSLTPTP
jgi:peptidyl-prolyl cis-trans isomerase SurA